MTADRSVAQRRAEVAAAGHRGDAVVVLAALEDDEPEIRATALGAAARTGRLDPRVLDRAAGDLDARVRRRAAEEAGHHPSTMTEPVLLGLTGDGDSTVAEMAAWALGESAPSERAVGVLSRMTTSHDDALCREAAVASLGALGDPAGLPAILAALSDRATVRRRAVLALAPFEGPEVEAALERARSDRDWQVRQGAEDLT